MNYVKLEEFKKNALENRKKKMYGQFLRKLGERDQDKD